MDITTSQRRLVTKLAYRLSSGGVDCLGRDRDDYTSLLSYKAACLEKTDAKYFVSALQNYARDLHREKSRSLDLVTISEANPNTVQKVDCENKILVRDMLRRIHANVEPEQWDLLMRYAENGCSIAHTWEALNRPGSRSGFFQKMNLLQKKCREILDCF